MKVRSCCSVLLVKKILPPDDSVSLFTFRGSPRPLTVTPFVSIRLLTVLPQHTDRILSLYLGPEGNQQVDQELRRCWVKPDPGGRALFRKAFNGVFTPTQSSNSPQRGSEEHWGNTAGIQQGIVQQKHEPHAHKPHATFSRAADQHKWSSLIKSKLL